MGCLLSKEHHGSSEHEHGNSKGISREPELEKPKRTGEEKKSPKGERKSTKKALADETALKRESKMEGYRTYIAELEKRSVIGETVMGEANSESSHSTVTRGEGGKELKCTIGGRQVDLTPSSRPGVDEKTEASAPNVAKEGSGRQTYAVKPKARVGGRDGVVVEVVGEDDAIGSSEHSDPPELKPAHSKNRAKTQVIPKVKGRAKTRVTAKMQRKTKAKGAA